MNRSQKTVFNESIFMSRIHTLFFVACAGIFFFTTPEQITHTRPYYHDGRYYYNQEEHETDSVWDHYKGLPLALIRKFPSLIGITKPLPCTWPTIEKTTFPAYSQEPLLTWINQSSFLFQIAGYNVLIDPVFSDCPPLHRLHTPGCTLEQLPKIDYIFISHNHADHTDFTTLQKLAQQDNPCFVLPIGNKQLFNSYGITNIVEKTWWEQLNLEKEGNSPLTITCLPARHWSCRKLLDANTALWSSWMFACDGFVLYYAGDSGYASHFKEIAAEFPHIDIAIMPIHPIKSSKRHMGPGDAITAFLDLKARVFVPTHWGSFGLENYPGERPIQRLTEHWKLQEEKLSKNCCLIYLFGETKNLQEACANLNQGKTGIIGLPANLPWEF
jgi:L-ascorbate metabolism protein UlaG (beta-lactamase superfamily)